jgi:HPt (histidine-containing phosphotransfer) domain-containing protein
VFDQPALDTEQFEEMHELLGEDYAAMLDAFFKDSADRLKLAQSQLLSKNSADQTLALDHLHTLKGASLSVGAARLSAICRHMEQLIRARVATEAIGFIDTALAALREFEHQAKQTLSL